MIFGIHYFLIMAGYSAAGLLLGSYMIRYAGATELDLGFIFMIQPLAVFARPLICAQADRYQSHKRLLTLCTLGNSLAYIPFIVIPYLLRIPATADLLTERTCYWLLIVAHAFGSLCFCGVRSLGDSLVVNYAKRIGSDFTIYRKFGAISFGTCGYLMGHINQGWYLPDYVPSQILNVVCMFILAVLFYAWPDEFFVIVGSGDGGELDDASRVKQQLAELPNGKQILAHMGSKLCGAITCRSRDQAQATTNMAIATTTTTTIATGATEKPAVTVKSSASFSSSVSSMYAAELRRAAAMRRPLSMQQQMRIFLLLMRRDIRIPLFLLLLLYGGLVGYAPPNFVFTYMDIVCNGQNICNAASLAGLVMISYCFAETLCYMAINALRRARYLNNVLLLEVTLASLALHYYFYGFLLSHLSPYFFLVESLHGLEYSASLSTSVELAYKFANEVELLMPELLSRGIISKEDDAELVKVSLMATMNACFTLVYDGFGTIIGVLIYGLVTDNYSFITTWILIGSLATVGFFAVLVIVVIGKCFDVKPQIYKLAADSGGASGSSSPAV